jgi:hypothetical protein
MQLVKRSVITSLKATQTKEDLYPFLQSAMALEFATIPVYLAGLFTICHDGDDSVNPTVTDIMTTVVNEEMLHLCIVANAMIALGGTPSIYPTLIPSSWPAAMPMGADDGLKIGIAAISQAVVMDTYMAIEEPDTIVQPTGNPIPAPLKPPYEPGDYSSIGDFYDALIEKILALPDGSFDPTSVDRQVTGVFYTQPEATPLPITDAASCIEQLQIIINEGEGSSTSPMESLSLDGKPEPAHFYRFAQIHMGNLVVVDGDTYGFTGASVGWDDSQAYPMPANPTLAQMAADPAAHTAALAFTTCFNTLCSQLNDAFTGDPKAINEAVDTMFELPPLARTVMETPFGNGQVAGLCFEVVATS